VRDLAQPRTLKSAAVAAAATTLACFPRLLLWTTRLYPLWYLVALLFLGTIVLWGFVFAWHNRYSGSPVFLLKPRLAPWVSATLAGLVCAVILRQFIDPSFRRLAPAEFPADLQQWMAMTLFSLTLNQLLFVFAPVDWLLRLFRNRFIATVLTVLFGILVFALKINQSRTTYPFALLSALVVMRGISGWLGVYFYLRGGVLLVWWLGFLIEARHLIDLMGLSSRG
jgi:hypothetical protein